MIEKLEKFVVFAGIVLVLAYIIGADNVDTRYSGSVWQDVAEATEGSRD